MDWKHEKRSPKTAQQIKIKATPPPNSPTYTVTKLTTQQNTNPFPHYLQQYNQWDNLMKVEQAELKKGSPQKT